MKSPSTISFIAALLLSSSQVDARINEPSSSRRRHRTSISRTQQVNNDEHIDQTSHHRIPRPRRSHKHITDQEQRPQNDPTTLHEEDSFNIARQTSTRNDVNIDSWREETAGGGTRDYNTNIVGGRQSKSERYPYFVSIFTTVNGEKYHTCGGTLIHDDIVMTAAHCANHAHNVRVGAYQPPSSAENGGDIYHDTRVIEKIEHPDYFRDSRERLHNDFMLLKLAEPVTDSRILRYKMNLNRVKKVDRRLGSGDHVTTIGLGRVNPGGNTAKTLREVELDFRTNEQCSIYFGDMPNEMMCAKSAGRDACEGDSGGPLIVKGDSPEEDMQVGIVSWGSGCANNFPGVYSRVAEAKEWIDDTVCKMSSTAPAKCPEKSRVRANAATSTSGTGCSDEELYCSGNHILPKHVFCFLNGSVCPVFCGKPC